MNSIEEMLAAAARLLDQLPEIRVQADSAAVGLVARTSAPTKDLPALLVRKSNVELVVLMGEGPDTANMIAAILHAQGIAYQTHIDTAIADIRKAYDALAFEWVERIETTHVNTDIDLNPDEETDVTTVPPAFSIEGEGDDDYIRISPIVLETEDEIEEYLDKLTDLINRLYDAREARAKEARKARKRRSRPDKD
jgi:alkanesulfonate monooxygenase SsuD/methylene tetrahydromethanopterin reductase-like flavin-dependent oxidoreductase (luciferase family)